VAVVDRSSAHIQAGNAYSSAKFYEGAIDHYGRAAKLDPTNVLIYAVLAIAHWKEADQEHGTSAQGEWDDRKKALANYRRGVSIDPGKMGELVASSQELKKVSSAAKRPDPPKPKGGPVQYE
jgi:tetratricopeptide (TPR) repeat protein